MAKSQGKSQAKSGWLRASVTVKANPALVWECWTKPGHIVQWNSPTAEWVTSRATNDCRPGGRFIYEMGLADGSLNFDFTGEYISVVPMESITHVLDDGRNTIIRFIVDEIPEDIGVTIIEDFEPDPSQDSAMQQAFCQAVLDHFRDYTESSFAKGS